ncbi:probable pectinesterase 29 [Cannabis sativa]|uniref:probable pectinesterase 29 n=1 Tax=Cannabis sativa TaxID=3483 RepID=UPI0029CA5C91|nr:probable pectinesterase 29 [Cannabis sativa]
MWFWEWQYMKMRLLLICIFFLLLLSLEIDGFSEEEERRSRLLFEVIEEKNKGNNIRTIRVDQNSGDLHGNFNTIQSAINSVPSYNKHWVLISIKAGIYREKIVIPSDKPMIILQGEGKSRTQVILDNHESLAQSPTFTSSAHNIIVRMMGFRNSYNDRRNNKRIPAVAALISGDKNKFYKCGFYGLQDTLWDDQGRHFYENCTIEGAVDFIFGGGQSIFQGCNILVKGRSLERGFVGFITAQGRTNSNDGSGFVFKNCNVNGSGKVFLGRPWRPYSRVLFYNSYLSKVVVPQGWNAWNSIGHENQLTFAENGCYGPGSDTSRRVGWEKKLSQSALNNMISESFIDNEGWLHSMPF